LIPDVQKLQPIEISHPGPRTADQPAFKPYSRDENLARPWAIPGTPGLMHRVGGLEKANGSGNVSYDADNHELMVKLRSEKVERIANMIPPQKVFGPASGELLVVSWGGTYGACHTAVQQAQASGINVAHCHLRHLNPFPSNLGDILSSYDKVLVPELNLGQLRMLLRNRYLVNALGYNKVKGKPFTVTELVSKIKETVSGSRNGKHN
jgi:2-oxoglutarate ferredoxin oxidoreductase subunit alpha